LQVRARKIRVRGLVQGVGFRPNVWRLARLFELTGSVLNDGEGVLVHVWGSEDNIAAFTQGLSDEKPVAAPLCQR
jgi:hydrogenase maturation protein HypF